MRQTDIKPDTVYRLTGPGERYARTGSDVEVVGTARGAGFRLFPVPRWTEWPEDCWQLFMASGAATTPIAEAPEWARFPVMTIDEPGVYPVRSIDHEACRIDVWPHREGILARDTAERLRASHAEHLVAMTAKADAEAAHQAALGRFVAAVGMSPSKLGTVEAMDRISGWLEGLDELLGAIDNLDAGSGDLGYVVGLATDLQRLRADRSGQTGTCTAADA